MVIKVTVSLQDVMAISHCWSTDIPGEVMNEILNVLPTALSVIPRSCCDLNNQSGRHVKPENCAERVDVNCAAVSRF